jgi:hypothetical protein
MACEDRPHVPMPWYLHPYFAALLSAAGVIASAFLLKRMAPANPLRVGAALLPVPASGFLVWTFVRWIRGLDELEHRIVFLAVSFAFVTGILAMMVLEGLERATVLSGVGWEAGWEGMVVLYALGYAWARRRYR